MEDKLLEISKSICANLVEIQHAKKRVAHLEEQLYLKRSEFHIELNKMDKEYLLSIERKGEDDE